MEDKLAFIRFEKDTMKVQIYAYEEVEREYLIKKEDYTYEMGLLMFEDVPKILVVGSETIRDAEILDMIAESKQSHFIRDIDLLKEPKREEFKRAIAASKVN